jgi:hypothetical protein
MMRVILFAIFLVGFWGCSDKEDKLVIEDEKDRKILEKLGAVHASTETYWPGYSIKNLPQFISIPDASRTTHGYFIYPGQPLPDGAASMDNYQTFGLRLARADDYADSPTTLTDTGGGLLFPALAINGVTYIAFAHADPAGTSPYFDYGQQDLNWLPNFTSHELFHRYQYMTWSSLNRKFDLANYPLSRDMIAWHLLLWDLAVDAYSLTSPADQATFLEQYVAIHLKMQSLDNSTELLISTMLEPLERIEGSARYVEHFMGIDTFFPNVGEDPTHGWSEFLTGTMTAELIRSTYGQRMAYHVGAIVTHLLKINGVNVAENYKSTTPFVLARTLVNLSTTESDNIIAGLEASPEWAGYLTKADEYYDILN